MKVAYLGPEGTNCYEACNKVFENDTKIGYKTITDTINSLIENKVDKCIVPLENSIQGSVYETIDTLFEKEELEITGEIVIDIKHYLLAKNKYDKSEIKEIHSHPQALAQCRKYIKNEFSKVEVEEEPSTAYSAKKVKDMDYTACIANKACKEVFGLEVIDENIQDMENNQTKFIILSLKQDSKIEYKKKTSIVFNTKHKPGALYKILGLFNIYDINMLKIESRPTKEKLGEYMFWIDFETSENTEVIDDLIKQIRRLTSYCRILGTY